MEHRLANPGYTGLLYYDKRPIERAKGPGLEQSPDLAGGACQEMISDTQAVWQNPTT
jgi:hypothetical protein